MATGRPFAKGTSGNPGGRSKAHAAISREILAKTNGGVELVDFALDVWRGKVDDMKTARDRQWAHDWLSDRGLGKPQQSVEVSTQGADIPDLSGLSLAELQRLASEDAGDPPPDAG